jgi:VWFA-related protein
VFPARSLTRSIALLLAAISTPVLTQARQQTPPAQQQPPQTPPPQQQEPQQPTFRLRVDSVSVDAIVLDKSGKPVTDLTADDFEIKESNKVQKIETFKFVRSDDEGPPPNTREILSIADQQRETANEQNRLFAIYLDDYHVRRSNSYRVHDSLGRFLNQLGPRDLVVVVYPLTPAGALTFSRNHEGTAAAIAKFEGRKYDYTPRNPFEERYQLQPPELLERMRNELTVSGLESLCTFMGGLREGRKTILFVSEGMSGTLPPGVSTSGNILPASPVAPSSSQSFFNSADLLSQFRLLFVAATRSNTSIYTLDPRGLATSEFDLADRVASEADRQVLNESLDSLRVIADNTDGRAIVNRNDPSPELRQMVRDSSAYYLLGYTTSVAPRDGKFHEIQVRVKRRDVDVRARKGYWAYTAEDAEKASAPPKPSAPRDVSAALDDLAEVVEPSSRRPIVVWLGAARGTGAGGKATITLAWEAAPGLTASSGEAVDHVTVMATSVYGETLFKGPIAKDAQATRPGGAVTFEAPPGDVRARVVAENARGMRLDTADGSVTVPDFTAPGPTISTPVVFRGRTARDLQVIKAAEAPVPTASRIFSRTERMLVRFEAYGPGGTAPKIALRLLNRNGDSLAALPPPAQGAAPNIFQTELVLAPLPPGDFLIEIAATSGTDTVRKLLAIRVTG